MSDETMTDIVKRDGGITLQFETSPEQFASIKQQLEELGDQFKPGLDLLIFKTKEEIESLRIAGVKKPGDTPKEEDWITIPPDAKTTLTQTTAIPITLWEHRGELSAWAEGNKRRKSFHIGNLKAETEAEQREMEEFLRELTARNERQGLWNPFPRVCPECGTEFQPVRSDQIYDSEKCATRVRSREYRERKRKHHAKFDIGVISVL